MVAMETGQKSFDQQQKKQSDLSRQMKVKMVLWNLVSASDGAGLHQTVYTCDGCVRRPGLGLTGSHDDLPDTQAWMSFSRR